MRPTLLLTRPEAQSRRFAADFRARFAADWPVVIAPLTGLRMLAPPPLPGDATDLIFTSETAVAAARDLPLGRLPAWCVGGRTAAAARAAGFPATQGPGDGRDLVAFIAQRRPQGRFLHLRGRDAAVDVAGLLAARGIACGEAVLYEQVSTPPTPEAAALLAGSAPVLVPLFSANGARALAALTPRAPLFLVAMSPAVAAACPPGAAGLEIAERPESGAMLDALARTIAGFKET
jgi:uroporphyrinogen-III synthase